MVGSRVRWSAAGTDLRGPFEPPGREAERLFEVVAEGGPLGLARIVSGEAWPSGLAPLDRIAAVPAPTGGSRATLATANAVLLAEDASGQRRGLCVPASDGGARWAFDPGAWIGSLLAEDYVGAWRRPLPSRIPGINYARLPHAIKGAAERILSRLPRPQLAPFPQLPLDTLVDDLRRLCQALAGGATEPRADLWPDGRRAVLTLTHDVDTGWILDAERRSLLREILDREVGLGFAGAWYVVAARVHPTRHRESLGAIREAGHEVGVHGWNHDAKLGFLGPARQERRLARACRRLEGLEVVGIRTPWYWRSPELFEVLEGRFRYDSSVPTASDLYGTKTRTGCCTVFPFAKRRMVELPLTLPPDTALPLPERVSTWKAVSERIIERRGLVMPVLHPQPHHSGGEAGLAAWFEFLGDLAGRWGAELWSATPAAIARRHATEPLAAPMPLR